MIQISSLWSLEEVEDYYYINDEQKVINIKTNKVKKATKSKQRGYWYYSLQLKNKKIIKVYVHKIIALAFINNGPYELIEHINDDKDDNSINNLKFSNKRNNTISAMKNGKIKPKDKKIVVIVDCDNNKYVGTIKEVAQKSGIPKSSIYYTLLIGKTYGRKIKFVKEIGKTGQQTIEKVSNA